MNSKWTKLLFSSCVLGIFLSFSHQEVSAGCSYFTRELKCAATTCDSPVGYAECVACYDGDVASAASANNHCFASVSEGCASDCTSDANCAEINPDACGS